MKKYLLSFGVILAFAFYVMLNNQSSMDIAGTAGSTSTANTAPATNPTAGANGGAGVTLNNPTVGGRGENEGGDDGGSGAVQSTTPPPTTAPKPTPTPAPTPTPTPTPKPTTSGVYKDGTYTGPVTDAYYGNVQVAAVIQGGKLADVQVLQYPSDRGTSRQINGIAMPQLVQEAVQAQSANVNIVSGATQSSEAFAQSLSSALAQAKA